VFEGANEAELRFLSTFPADTAPGGLRWHITVFINVSIVAAAATRKALSFLFLHVPFLD
jgi:hypothetical protein